MANNDYSSKNGKDKPTRKPGKVGEGYDAPFRGYINLNLSPEEKQAYVKWAEGASFWDQFSAFVRDGVNISVKYEAKADTFLCSATQRRESSPNAGLVVTARGGNPDIALTRCVYCLVLLAHSERWEDTQPVADPDRW